MTLHGLPLLVASTTVVGLAVVGALVALAVLARALRDDVEYVDATLDDLLSDPRSCVDRSLRPRDVDRARRS